MCVGEHLQEQKTKNEYSVKTQNTQEQYEQTKDHGNVIPTEENRQQDATEKKVDPITETIDRIDKQMPAVETQVVLNKNMYKTNLHYATARLSLARRKNDEDSPRMKKIKNVLKKLSTLMEGQMPFTESDVHEELEKRYALYELLEYYCTQYTKERRFSISSIGRARRAIINELGESAKQEKEKLRASCQAVYQERIAQQENQNQQDWKTPQWSEVLEHARTEQLTELPEGYRFLKKGGSELTAAKKSAAVYRLAAFLNMTDVVEEVKPADLRKDGEEEKGFLIEAGEHKTMKDLKKECKDMRIYYDPKALYDMMRIREMDSLLQIRRKESDLSVYWTVEKGKYVVHSVKAIHNGELIGTEYIRKKGEFLADGKLANLILAIPKELINGMFVDVLSKRSRVKLEESFRYRQQVLESQHIRYLRTEQYRSDGMAILADLEKTDFQACAWNRAMHDNATVDLSRSMVHHTPIQRINESTYIGMGVFVKAFGSLQQVRTDEGKKFLAALEDWMKLWNDAQTSQNREKLLACAKELGRSQKAWKQHLQTLLSGSETAEEEEIKQQKVEQGICNIFSNQYYKMFSIDSVPDKYTDPKMDEQMLKAEIEYRQLEDQVENKNRGADFDWAKRVRLEDRSYEPLFPHLPTPSDVKQGYVGDCFFLGVLMTIVERNPNIITNMMIDQGDRVKVVFPEKTVVVSKKILVYEPVDGKTEALGARGELWVQIMEKAYLAAGFAKQIQHEDEIEEKKNYEAMMTQNDYWNSLSSIGSGWSDKALEKVLPLHSEEVSIPRITIQSMHHAYIGGNTGQFIESAYDNLWNNRVTGKNPQEKYPEKWAEIKDLLTDILKEPLETELKQRFSTRDEDGNVVRYKAVTIEDVKDTLKDMREWQKMPGKHGYWDIYQDVRKVLEKDHGIKLTRGLLDRYVGLLAEEMELANETYKSGFQHRSDASSTQPKYTEEALKIARIINAAATSHIPLTAYTQNDSGDNMDGLNGEAVENGIVYTHCYMVEGAARDKTGHIYVKMRNPWGHYVPQYATVTEADGRKHQTTIMNEETATEGVFELELNDFMVHFESLQHSDFDYNLSKAQKNEHGGSDFFK